MSNEDPNAPVTPIPSRRSPRQGVGGSPMGSTISIVLAVVAVVVGFLILNNITDDGPSASGGVETPVGSAPENTATTNSALENTTTSTTAPVLVTAGATVVVANASGVAGAAGRMTDELTGLGVALSTDANGRYTKLDPYTGAQLALGKRIQRGDVGEDAARRMKCADQIFALRQIHGGLAADR